jgi:hypothetical protein
MIADVITATTNKKARTGLECVRLKSFIDY